MSLISSKISNEDSKINLKLKQNQKLKTKESKHEDRSITETSDQLAKQEQEGQGRSQNEPKQELIQSLNKYVSTRNVVMDKLSIISQLLLEFY